MYTYTTCKYIVVYFVYQQQLKTNLVVLNPILLKKKATRRIDVHVGREWQHSQNFSTLSTVNISGAGNWFAFWKKDEEKLLKSSTYICFSRVLTALPGRRVNRATGKL